MALARWCGLASATVMAVACGSDDGPIAGTAGTAGTAGAAGSAGIAGADAGGVPDAAQPDAADSASDRTPTEWPPPEPATTLPLEVLGAPGAGVEVSLVVDAADLEAARAQSSAQLVLTVHNVVAPESAEVRINDGTPIDLGDPQGPFLRRFDGQVASGKIAIDPARLQTGQNNIVFRYTRQVIDRAAAVSGFRVLAVSVELAGKKLALELPAEDPTAWRPLDATPDAIERGRSFFQDVSRDGGPACARCHADSGADLQYYAFSTKSLVERAMFHQFTRAEARDLASYIRSLALVPKGRPYDAPFQPGASNHGAAGAGYSAILSADASFAETAFGAASLPATLGWNWPETVDTFRLPTRAAAPTWMRWLPRELEDDWFTRKDGILATTERALAATPSLETAQAFMSAALTVGKDILLLQGDYQGKIDVLRFAAVKLWDWSRQNGFERADHGVPDGSPAYPYEVGFAFFEAMQADAFPGAAQQTMNWWWAQLAANPGRGVSTGRRPLNFEDVLLAAENAGLGSRARRVSAPVRQLGRIARRSRRTLGHSRQSGAPALGSHATPACRRSRAGDAAFPRARGSVPGARRHARRRSSSEAQRSLDPRMLGAFPAPARRAARDRSGRRALRSFRLSVTFSQKESPMHALRFLALLVGSTLWIACGSDTNSDKGSPAGGAGGRGGAAGSGVATPAAPAARATPAAPAALVSAARRVAAAPRAAAARRVPAEVPCNPALVEPTRPGPCAPGAMPPPGAAACRPRPPT